jgi:hypothetical protein
MVRTPRYVPRGGSPVLRPPRWVPRIGSAVVGSRGGSPEVGPPRFEFRDCTPRLIPDLGTRCVPYVVPPMCSRMWFPRCGDP